MSTTIISGTFITRVANSWNNVCENVISAPNVNIFKNRLDKPLEKHPVRYENGLCGSLLHHIDISFNFNVI